MYDLLCLYFGLLIMSSVEEVVKLIDGLDKASCGNKTERVMLQLALARANRRLQSPWDVAYEHCWEAPATAGSLDTLTEVGLWDEWVKAGAKPSTPEELSKLVPMDAVLLSAWSSGMHFLSTMRSLRTNN